MFSGQFKLHTLALTQVRQLSAQGYLDERAPWSFRAWVRIHAPYLEELSKALVRESHPKIGCHSRMELKDTALVPKLIVRLLGSLVFAASSGDP